VLADAADGYGSALPLAHLCVRLTFSTFANISSPHSRIAAPLHIGHFARHDINLERAAWAREPVLGQQDNIVTWFEKNSEPTCGICGERFDRPLVAADGKRCVWKRRRIGKFGPGPDRSRTSWTYCDDPFDSRSRSSTYLGESYACKQERQNYSYYSKPRYIHLVIASVSFVHVFVQRRKILNSSGNTSIKTARPIGWASDSNSSV
jgi:hypothetical protein